MNPEEVKELLVRRPFLPFRIQLLDGEGFDIRRPTSCAIGRRILFIVLPDDRWKCISLQDVAGIKTP